MQAKTYNLLKEKLGDATVQSDGKDVPMLDWLNEIHEAATVSVPKLENANKDLVSQRDEWDTSKKELKKQIADLTSERDALKKASMSDDDRKKLESLGAKGMTPEVEAQFNALKEKVETLTQTVTNTQTELKNERENTATAKLASVREAMRTSLLTALAKHKIEGSKAEIALAAIEQKGFAKINTKDDGSHVQTFQVFNDNGDPLAVNNAAELAERFAKDNPYLVSGSKAGGSGDDHQYNPNDHNQRPDARSMLDMNNGYD